MKMLIGSRAADPADPAIEWPPAHSSSDDSESPVRRRPSPRRDIYGGSVRPHERVVGRLRPVPPGQSEASSYRGDPHGGRASPHRTPSALGSSMTSRSRASPPGR
eukprot:CAMPEP_0194292824 /NCGR_PEP_ID=MMETSP0169-20130528/46539_1 /TAXON_ID=218684 /ORGANISM="Corethron pennatum, Strain L29A3" /LENGTH=104 /DNA_ID=CAMNT_0039041143 /DNA_START=46 /DNA_END=357 /DNA_ORIENTATION=+